MFLQSFVHSYLPVPRVQGTTVAEVQLQLDIGADVPVDGDEDGVTSWRHGRAGAADNALWCQTYSIPQYM